MERSYETSNGNGVTNNGHMTSRNSSSYQSMNGSLPWLDLRVFYFRVSKCEIDNSTPEYLTVNYVPVDRDTLLEVNGARTTMSQDSALTYLRRDRLDKKSEEATFVSTDGIRMTGNVKFEVYDKDILLLYGLLKLSTSNGSPRESRDHSQGWTMNCETDIVVGTSFLKARRSKGPNSGSPRIEVYVAGSFLGTPIILTTTLQLSLHKKQARKGKLDSIPEYEATEGEKDAHPTLSGQISDYSSQKPEYEDYSHTYSGTLVEGEDGELSWFNAGVRVGVGIGLSVCLGLGIGVGLMVRTYQGATSNFRRRLR